MTALSISAVLKQATADLKNVSGETARLDAEILLADILSCARIALYSRAADLDIEEKGLFSQACARRILGEPTAYITGTQAFWDHDFFVSPATLIPRQDTETLVEVALKALSPTLGAHILDIGTGTGCILLSLLAERHNAEGVGLDISPAAVKIAEKNAIQIGVQDRVRFIESNWFSALPTEGQKFDCIVSNPPYIPSNDIGGLMKDVRDFEPMSALDGGINGLAAYREICSKASQYLKVGGSLSVEIGVGQATDVATLFAAAGFNSVETIRDLPGIERIVTGKKP